MADHSELVQIYLEQVMHGREGQAMDLNWRETGCCPTVPEYLDMATRKSGCGAALAIRLLLLADKSSGKDKVGLTDVFRLLGLYAQIWNDVKSLNSEQVKRSLI